MNSQDVPESIITRIKNVLKLAKEGATEGERTAANKALVRLLARYKLTIDDLTAMETKRYEFAYKNEYELTLLKHLAPRDENGRISYRKKPRSKLKVWFWLTRVQHIDMKDRYAFYRKGLAETLDLAVVAYMNRNKLLAANTSDNEPTEEELERWRKVKQMEKGITAETYNKKLTVGASK